MRRATRGLVRDLQQGLPAVGPDVEAAIIDALVTVFAVGPTANRRWHAFEQLVCSIPWALPASTVQSLFERARERARSIRSSDAFVRMLARVSEQLVHADVRSLTFATLSKIILLERDPDRFDRWMLVASVLRVTD